MNWIEKKSLGGESGKISKGFLWSLYLSPEIVLIASFCFLNNNISKKLSSLINLASFPSFFQAKYLSFAAGPIASLYLKLFHHIYSMFKSQLIIGGPPPPFPCEMATPCMYV
jgi:hypothetical protein